MRYGSVVRFPLANGNQCYLKRSLNHENAITYIHCDGATQQWDIRTNTFYVVAYNNALAWC